MVEPNVGIFDSLFTENKSRTTLISDLKHSNSFIFKFQIAWFVVVTGYAMIYSSLANKSSYYGQIVLLAPIIIPSISYLNSIYPTIKEYAKETKSSRSIAISIYSGSFWVVTVATLLAIVSSQLCHKSQSDWISILVIAIDISVFIMGIFDKFFLKIISDARVRNSIIIKKGEKNV